jgi:O-antigen/teichoic acid export membrane protein
MRGRSRRFAELGRLWGPKLILSIADQGLFAGSSFLLNILLTRWLSPSEYGAFAVIFSVFLFLSGFHNAFVLEPVSVLGPARHRDLPQEYLANLLWTHAAVCLAILVLTAAGCLVLRGIAAAVAGPLLGLALSSPFLLSFWLLRRLCYLRTEPALALRGSAVYALLLAAALLVMRWQGWVRPFVAFLALGLASGGAGLFLWRRLNLRSVFSSRTGIKSAIPAFLSQHWRYAKWVLGSVFVSWLSGAVYVPLVGSLAGLEAAGVLQAMQNPLRPLQNILTAFGLLFLPWISRQRASRGEGRAGRLMLWILLAFGASAVAYLLPLAAARHWVLRTLYRAGYYDGFSWLLLYLCAGAMVAALVQGLSIWLKALERPNASFWSQAAGAVLTVTAGAYLLWKFQLSGAAFALILDKLAMLLVSLSFLVRYSRARQ